MSNKPNVTYLLGAGASANALPVINELPERLLIFKDILKGRLQIGISVVSSSDTKFRDSSINAIANILIEDIDWAISEMSAHATVDTLAKRFYLIRDKHNDLIKLKKVLYTYFLFEQGYNFGKIRKDADKEIPDKRYDSLIATTISNQIDNLSLPGTIKVITWNYDIQFEIAFKRYLLGHSYEDIQNRIQVFPSNKNSILEIEMKNFSIVHLNGIINQIFEWDIISQEKIKSGEKKLEILQTEYLTNICKIYNSIEDEHLKKLTYSWEDPENFNNTIPYKNNIIQISKDILKQTDILVIIGYSFPIFNRNIDKELMKNLNKNVRKIYIQDRPEEVEVIRNVFINSFSSDIESYPGGLKQIISTVSYINQFHIPAEMNL